MCRAFVRSAASRFEKSCRFRSPLHKEDNPKLRWELRPDHVDRLRVPRLGCSTRFGGCFFRKQRQAKSDKQIGTIAFALFGLSQSVRLKGLASPATHFLEHGAFMGRRLSRHKSPPED